MFLTIHGKMSTISTRLLTLMISKLMLFMVALFFIFGCCCSAANSTINSGDKLINLNLNSSQSQLESPTLDLSFEAAFQGECRSNGPCQHLCFDLHDGTFECSCRDGFTLADNGYSCSTDEPDDGFKLMDLLTAKRSKSNSSRPSKRRGATMTAASRTTAAIDQLFNSCLEVECEAGGTCIEEGPPSAEGKWHVRCRCPLGRKGPFCEKPSEVRFPRFRGNSYLALPTLRGAQKSMQVSIEFRPEEYEGLLLYSGEKQNLEGDFIALLLNQGFVEFRFDCGMGEGFLRSDRPVLLNSWNTVTLYRDGWTAWLQLNNGQQVSGQSHGLFSRIAFRLELFLGGSPNLTLVAGRTKSLAGLTGCVRKLEISGRSYDFRSDSRGDAIDGIDIEECGADVCSRTSCLNAGQCVATSPEKGICLCPLGFGGANCELESDFTVPSFNGSSYLQFPGFGSSLNLFFEIQVVFKPKAANGVLLYNGQLMGGSGGGDFLSVNLIDGFVEFRFDPGNGPAVIRSQKPVSLDEWHTLVATRTARLGTLHVDDQAEVGALSSGAFTQLSLPLNLFVGGLSDLKDASSESAITSSFRGCIQKLAINGRSIMLLDEALSGVNVADCVHPCASPGPCQEGGRCEPLLDSFTCHCPLGLVGEKCEKVEEMMAIPMFYGNSFLHYMDDEVMKRIRGSKMDLSLRFRAFSPEGLLLWSAGGHQKQQKKQQKLLTSVSSHSGNSDSSSNSNSGISSGGIITMTSNNKNSNKLRSIDFMSVSLKDGLLRYSFNLGSGEVTLFYNFSRVDDGVWHNLRITRFKREATMIVDSWPVAIGTAPGNQVQLDVHSGLYLGGLEDLTVQTRRRHKRGIIGCVSHITLATDYHLKLVTQATRGVNIRPCI